MVEERAGGLESEQGQRIPKTKWEGEGQGSGGGD